MKTQPYHPHSTAHDHPTRPTPQINLSGYQSATPDLLVYVGLTAIAKAVGAGPNTIKRWIREEGFPVRRCSDGIYRATAHSMQQWFQPPALDAQHRPVQTSQNSSGRHDAVRYETGTFLHHPPGILH